VKLGDLIQVRACGTSGWSDFDCECFFCRGHSNRIGLVAAPAPGASGNGWYVSFDCGQTRLDEFDVAQGYVKVIGRPSNK
jgi:hypothetical protein